MHNTVDFRKISKYVTPDESPGYLLWRVSSLWRTAIEKTLKTYDLTHPQFVVLAVIGWLTKESGHISQAKISRAVGLDPNTVSQIIRGLEKKKFINRAQKVDERSKNPTLTALGNSILIQALPAVERADTDFFTELSRQEVHQIVTIFQKLLFNVLEEDK
jgi:DNA-binding MarR family transcriptional regulator